jgi:hypothetical protein
MMNRRIRIPLRAGRIQELMKPAIFTNDHQFLTVLVCSTASDIWVSILNQAF